MTHRKSHYPYICRVCGQSIYLARIDVGPRVCFGSPTNVRRATTQLIALHEHELGENKVVGQRRYGDVLRARLEERCRNKGEETRC